MPDFGKKISESFKRGETVTCLEWLRIAMAEGEDTVIWRHVEGIVYQRLGRYNDAERVLLEVYPLAGARRYLIEYILGEIYEAKGLLTKAESYFMKAVHSAPDNPTPKVYLGGFYMRRERFDEAMAVLWPATEHVSDLADLAWFNLSRCQRALGDYTAARQSCERALQISPDYSLAQEDLKDLIAAESVRRCRGDVASALSDKV